MFVEFTPEGEPAQTWHFKTGEIMGDAAERIEDVAGMDFDMWSVRLRAGSFKARKVLLWYLQTLTHPGLQYRDMPNFKVEQLLVSYTSAELTAIREAIANGQTQTPLTADERAERLAVIDTQLAGALAREAANGETAEGKAPSEPSSIDGGSTS